MGQRVDGPGARQRAGSLLRRRRVRAQADEMAALLDAAAPRERRSSGRRAAAVPATAFAVLSLGGVGAVLGFAPTSAGAHLELPDAGAGTAAPASPEVAPTGSSGTLDDPITDLPADAGDERSGAATAPPAHRPVHRAPARPAPAPGAREPAAGAAPSTTRAPRATTAAPRPTTGRSAPPTTTTVPTTQADDGGADTPGPPAERAGENEETGDTERFAGRPGTPGDGTVTTSDPTGW